MDSRSAKSRETP